MGLDIDKPGKYILHASGDGRPHCVGILRRGEVDCVIYDGDGEYVTSMTSVGAAWRTALDADSIVTFALVAQTSDEGGADDTESQLLDLLAGAGRRAAPAFDNVGVDGDDSQVEVDVNLEAKLRQDRLYELVTADTCYQRGQQCQCVTA